MRTHSDFEEMLLAFNDAGVEYLVVGAYAVAEHARPRGTGDIDLFVASERDNAARIYRALTTFGAPLHGIDEQTFCERDIVFQIGIPPIRIDILTGIDGVSFADAWPRRIAARVGDVPVSMIGRADLITNKRASGRAKDLADLELLEEPS